MTDCCPTCGQALPETGLKVDLAQNVIIHGQHAVQLTAAQAEIAFVLVRHAPRLVHHHELRAALYGASEGGKDEDGTINVLIRRIRKKVEPLGIWIKSVRSVGYHLSQTPPKTLHALWTPEIVEQFHQLCKDSIPREIIAQKLGWSVRQVENLDKHLRQKNLSRYRLPYSSGIARRRYAA